MLNKMSNNFILVKFFAAVLLTASCLLLATDGVELDCSIGSSSCESCHVAYPFCYWCDSKPSGQQCRRYYENYVDVECPRHSRYKVCDARSGAEREKLERIYKVLLELRSRGKTGRLKQGTLPRSNALQDIDTKTPEGLGGNELFPAHRSSEDRPAESTSDLQLRKARLMKALRLLKLIEYLEAKQQAKKHSVPTSDRDLEHSLSNTGSVPSSRTDNSKYLLREKSFRRDREGLRNMASYHDLDDLLKGANARVNEETTSSVTNSMQLNPSTALPITERSKVTARSRTRPAVTMNHFEATTFLTSTVKTVLATTGEEIVGSTKSKISKVDVLPASKGINPTGCALLDEEDVCNNNSTCAWCNLMDLCMNRNDDDMKFCYSQSKRSSDGTYVIDRCLKHDKCEPCVKDGKCFWCEKTKSCHVYPFFGFVPHNCPANKWYYKDCDVQLAIFIILFPLLIILIAMIIFYFCLRYCYYKKRTLKVPLFEKPGLIEKKQGKKIYFMGAEEEDDEYRTEQIRKKYKLPIEKEPLIAP